MRERQAWVMVLCCLFLVKPAHADEPCTSCGGNCGEWLGTLQGVDAFSNGAKGNCTGTGRGVYQCVEYVKRFNGRSDEWWGNANQIFDRAEKLGLKAFKNGGTEPPKQGDALTFLGGYFGHIAIIYTVENDAVTLIEQNWHNTPGYFRRLSMRVEDGQYTIISNSKIYMVQGWLRSASDPSLTDDDGDEFSESGGDCDDTNPNIHPGAEERCNNIDDNCDGQTDEDPEASQSCEDGIDCTDNYCSSEIHACSQFYVHERCDDGDLCTTDLCTLTGCRAIPKDDDFDGFMDRSCGGDDCDDSNFNIHPGATEHCNDLDDDCDGEMDEDWKTGLASDLGNPCSVGRGECQREGVFICTPDGLATVCSADPGLPTAELCDGRDNDCDNETDEDWPDLGLACSSPPCDGIYYCTPDGTGIYCFTTTGDPELCDGLDNNCDGRTDETPEADLSCNDGNDCTVDTCVAGACQNTPPDTDGDTHSDSLCGGDDCNDADPLLWQYDIAQSRVTNSSGASFVPSLAWTGTEYGLTWSDQRSGDLEIYFTRLNSSGSKIGSDVRITNAAGDSTKNSLAWTGSEFGLALQDSRTIYTEIYFTRLDISGTKLISEVGVTTAHPPGTGALSPILIWQGSEFGIFFADTRSGLRKIFFARLTPDGIEIGEEAPLISTWDELYSPFAVWTGTEYALVWYQDDGANKEIFFGRFTSTGSSIGTTTVISSIDRSFDILGPHLTFSGSEYAVSWGQSSTGEILFTRLDASGNKISPDIHVASVSIDTASPEIAFRDSEYGLVWHDYLGDGVVIHFVRLSLLGDILGENTQLTDSSSFSLFPVIVSKGNDYGLAWYSSYPGDWEIYFARLGCNW
jgi:hypothetical protein